MSGASGVMIYMRRRQCFLQTFARRSELFGGIKDGGLYSLAELGKLVSPMADRSLDAPDMSALVDKSFDHQHGWGDKSQPGALSRMLGMIEEKTN